ncbi:Uu.00g025420.m01.CDS01 [Anthostomella pinea]|uniref:Uu.00g025420.m01.CDS01 n=1 Tax=Anthostomella pinea TaxID=933095 RepID=A0AAI8V771_9PEZI|nr:Uu.00g025420.m01.CDS01 [Anthostomella pinea]
MTADLRFDPQGDGWTFNKETQTYDLRRASPSRRFTVLTSQGPPNTSVTLAPALSALVVIDMQNFFLHPRCNDHPSGLAAVERTLQDVDKWREIGIKVIWLNWGLTDEDIVSMPAAAQHSFASAVVSPPVDDRQATYGFGSDMGDDRGRLLVACSWNAQLYDPLQDASRPGSDLFCDKNRISGLWNSEMPLAKALPGAGSRTLLFAGVNTDQCILGTLADAYYRGFDCILLENCCATKTPGGQEVTVYNTARGYGFVVDSRSFCDDLVTS